MPNKPAVTIIIPAYNEERGVTSVITQLKDLSGNYEILVVDDGSTDNTYKLAVDMGVKVIRHPYNKGYGNRSPLVKLFCLRKDFYPHLFLRLRILGPLL